MGLLLRSGVVLLVPTVVPVPAPVPKGVLLLGFLVWYGLSFCFESTVDLGFACFNVEVVVRLVERRMRSQTMEMTVMPSDAMIATLVLKFSWRKVNAQLRSDCDEDGVTTTGNAPPAVERDGEKGGRCFWFFPSCSVTNAASRWNQAPRVSMAEACSAWVSQSGMHEDTLVHCGWNGERGANGSLGVWQQKKRHLSTSTCLVCRARDYYILGTNALQRERGFNGI